MAKTLSVSALNLYVKSLLEEDYNLADVAVEGEISGFINHYKSGHFYFSLKDQNAVIKTVMFSFNNKNLTFLPENGMKVIVRGKVSLYEKDGSYQLYAQEMFASGVGLQHLVFEKLKEKLQKEGLFDDKHKKTLPKYPFVIGVATSATGAALQDIISVAKRRFPCVKIIVADCTVQGDNAKDSIINAISKLDKIEEIETIIIARGGGSKESLWVFNDEEIARAAYNCKKPTISAVGHEIDFSILDFVCDVRAATPTAAVELALPDIDIICNQILNFDKNISKSITNKIDTSNKKLQYIKNSKGFNNVIAQCKNNFYKVDNYLSTFNVLIKNSLEKNKRNLLYCENLLEQQNPLNNLKKGYALIFKDNKAVNSKASLQTNENIVVRTHSQMLDCTITKIEEIKQHL